MTYSSQLDGIGPIGEALLRRARGTSQDLAALLHDVEVFAKLDDTRVTFHCHCLKHDGNNRPRVADLVSAICDHVLDFAIPRSNILAAQAALNNTGSTAPLMRLRQEASSLFTDLANTGEGGELLLFVMAEAVLKLPQLLCKMDLKTNSRMHIHGADGLHAGVDPASGHLLLYWGESKLYADPVDAVRECFASIAPMLKSSGESGQGTRDMQLLGRHADLADEPLTGAVKRFLDPRDERFNQLEFCGLCLVGYDSDAYPSSSQNSSHEEVVQNILAQLPRVKAAIARRVGNENLTQFAFHVISVPFPSVEDFRSRLLSLMGLQ